MSQRLLDWFVAFATACAIAGFVAVYAKPFNWPPIRSDGYGYYIYLPAWFIHHDPTLERTAADCCGGEYPIFSLISRWPTTGRLENPHPIGEALMLIPFFIVADGLTRWTNLSRDGFTLYYQWIVAFAGVVYFSAGLLMLRKILLRRFTPGISLAVLTAIVFGTNLFHYATYDSLFSHAYSFCLFAVLLYLVPAWLERPSFRNAAAIGAVSALIVLVRHTDALLLLFPVLYGITSIEAGRARFALLWSRRSEVTLMTAMFAALILPQLILYHYQTGQWVFSPYRAIGSFSWGSPKLPQVLFSVQKGLFFWSPLLLLSVAGIPLMRRHAPELFLPTMIVLPVLAYVIASWVDWQMGGSYGHRGFTDVLPVFAIALASLFAELRSREARNVVAVAASLCVALSIVQMFQYWNGIVPFANTTWDYYRAHFLRFSR